MKQSGCFHLIVNTSRIRARFKQEEGDLAKTKTKKTRDVSLTESVRAACELYTLLKPQELHRVFRFVPRSDSAHRVLKPFCSARDKLSFRDFPAR